MGKELKENKAEPNALIVSQYEQLHEMRREYNRFIFQAPTIVVAVVAGTLALVSRGKDFFQVPNLHWIGPLLIVLSGFILVIGYWAFRSRILLRQAERTLKSMEATYGGTDFAMYPYEVNRGLSAWKRGPSTAFIVFYIFILGLVFLLAGLFVLIFCVSLWRGQ